jgi:hypothetical protein
MMYGVDLQRNALQYLEIREPAGYLPVGTKSAQEGSKQKELYVFDG